MPFPWLPAAMLTGIAGNIWGANSANRTNREMASQANQANYVMAQQANESNREMAREQMSFQERMSNTAYQRAMLDMKTAGLNPILAYSQGGAAASSGASSTFTPSRSSPSRNENIMSGVSSSAMDAIRMRSELDNMDAQTVLTRNSAKKIATENELLQGTRGKEKFVSGVYGDASSAYAKSKELSSSLYERAKKPVVSTFDKLREKLKSVRQFIKERKRIPRPRKGD